MFIEEIKLKKKHQQQIKIISIAKLMYSAFPLFIAMNEIGCRQS